MNDAVIKDKIRGFIVKNFYVAEPSTLTDDTSFLDAGIIDSTGVLEMVLFLQACFGIAVSEDEVIPESFDSIDALTTFVEYKRSLMLDRLAG